MTTPSKRHHHQQHQHHAGERRTAKYHHHHQQQQHRRRARVVVGMMVACAVVAASGVVMRGRLVTREEHAVGRRSNPGFGEGGNDDGCRCQSQEHDQRRFQCPDCSEECEAAKTSASAIDESIAGCDEKALEKASSAKIDVEIATLRAQLREAKEKVKELEDIMKAKCQVTDYTQCASACYSRVMRIKEQNAQCTRRLQNRGCTDCTVVAARSIAKDRIATRRAAYHLIATALKAESKCGGGGTPIDVDRERMKLDVTDRERASEIQEKMTKNQRDEITGQADMDDFLVSTIDRSTLLDGALAHALEDSKEGNEEHKITAEAYEKALKEIRAAAAAGASAERNWLEQLRNRAEDINRRANLKESRMDKSEVFRHDMAAELSFPSIYGIPQSLGRALYKLADTRGKNSREMLKLTPRYNRNFKTCAVVGNSQRLLLDSNGAKIDEHSAVIRMNNAPTVGFEQFVGNKTTLRTLNSIWTQRYSNTQIDSNRVANVMPLELGVTLVGTRVVRGDHVALQQRLRKSGRGDVNFVKMTDSTIMQAGKLLQNYKTALESVRELEYAGKGSPSSGFLAIFAALQICDKVTVYGVGTESDLRSGSSQWHYWEKTDYYKTSREFGEAPHHSWELERDVLLVLEATNKLRIVTPRSRDNEAARKVERIATAAILDSDAAVRRHRTIANQQCARVGLSVCGCDPESDPLHGGSGVLEVAGKVSHGQSAVKSSVTLQKFDKVVAKKDEESVVQRAAIALARSYNLELTGVSASASKKKKAATTSSVGEYGGDASREREISDGESNDSVVDAANREDVLPEDHHEESNSGSSHGGHGFMSNFFHGN